MAHVAHAHALGESNRMCINTDVITYLDVYTNHSSALSDLVLTVESIDQSYQMIF